MTSDGYVLGHADVEIQRLLLQGRLYNSYTEHALRQAGLRPGMRVLDLGCGPGDVSMVAAGLVGRTGAVLGIDAAGEIIELARARAAEHGLSTVRFEQATIEDVAVNGVDAVVGRLILMHLPDPVSALRRLATLVRPGGVIVFSEFDVTAAGSVPDSALARAIVAAIIDAFHSVGLDPAFGTTLPPLFRRAGLEAPRLALSAPVGGASDTEVLAYAVEVWRLMYPVAEQVGTVPDELADLDTLLQRMQEEVAAHDAIVKMPAMITAWARAPI